MVAGEGHQAKTGTKGREVMKSMGGSGVAGGKRVGNR